MLERFKDFKHDWERPYLEGSRERIFKNTFKDIEYILTTCAENGTRFEIECYDIGHLYTLAHFADRGIVKPPFFVQSVFGILGGIGPHPEDVAHMKRTADRLFGDNYRWSVLGAGRNQLPIATLSAAMGGNVRVGLEDSLWVGPGQLAKTNADQVKKARQIIEGLGLEVATPDDAREILELKGGSEVAFLMLRIEVFSDRKESLGEGPLWDVKEQRLYWIDSYGPTVHRADAKGGDRKSWTLPEPIGSHGAAREGRRCRLLALRLPFPRFRHRRSHPHQRDASRTNSGRASMTARSIARAASSPAPWISTRRDPVGKLFRLDPDLSVHTLDTGIVCSNGPCWSPDGKTFYFADSYTRAIWAYDYDTETGNGPLAPHLRDLRQGRRLSRRRHRRCRRLCVERRGLCRRAWCASIPMASSTASSVCPSSRRRA